VKSVLILGAGGTAKSIAVILKSKGYEVTILNRSKNSEEFFLKSGCEFYDWDSFPISQSFDLIVNSTSAGLKEESYPAPLSLLEPLVKNAKYAVDCIYGKVTPFLQLAQKHHKICKDGEDMLLFQGVLAFELFTGIKADEKLIEVMRIGLKNLK
jgi:shikimate dehydrogenase